MPLAPQHSDTIKLLRITAVFWFIAKIISFKVWTTNRIFPVVPVFDAVDNMPGWVHLLLLGLSLICVLLLAAKPQIKLLGWMLIGSELCSIMLDYTRWQPWEYQYLFILFIFLVNKDEKNIRIGIGFLLAALYIYSGLQKINIDFLLQIWDNMILNSLFHLSHATRVNSIIFYSGFSLGIIEFCAGAGLLFKRTQKTAAVFLIIMHLFNLLWLGPLGAKYNIIIWPWNMAMCIYLYLLFINNRIISFRSIFVKWNIIVLIAWGLLPALNFAGLWDNYLSGSLYSGKLPLMAACIDSETALKPYISIADTKGFCPDKSLVKLQAWALKELNVPPYPQERVYKKIAKKLHQLYPGCVCYAYIYRAPLQKTIIE
jgi:hypothetical protein